MADEKRSYMEQVEAARLAASRGDRAEAERLLIGALETGERAFGAEHPSLGTALNELGRLYIRQAQHARAEEVLERLLRITRAKGDEHPDVATALAGLAVVKRGLGDEASAEQLLRGALRIRERALAPQHMATVVAMEQLAEICASRGNVAEALALLQRALPTRDAALGADHATVRTLRSRIAELELRALASNFASSAPEPSAETHVDAAPESGVAEPVAAPVDAPDATASPALLSAETSAPHRVEPARRPRRKRVLFLAFGAVAAVALATVGMTARSRANAANIDGSASSDAHQTEGASSATNAATRLAGSETAPIASPHSASDTSAPVVQAGMPFADSAPAPAAPKLPHAPKNLAAVTAQLVAGANVDSMVRASTLDKTLPADRIGAGIGIVTSPHLEDAGAKPAVLVAPAPLPRFPDELRAHWTESEVVVRFRVDERGRVDVGSMKVLQSDHELFVAAVREVLPRFRFEPARSAAPESKPTSDWVDYRVRFAATK